MSLFVLAAQASRDVTEILTYLEERSPPAAVQFETELLDAFQSFASMPFRYQVREEFAKAPIRTHVLREYLIFYNPAQNPLLILRVVHGRRNVSALLKEAE